MKRMAAIFLLLIFFWSSGCGSATNLIDATIPSGVAPPIITRTSPTAASAGDTVTVFGVGFSAVPELNTVVVGNSQASADSYALVANPSGDEVENITFVVPAGVNTGVQAIYVIAIDEPSNTDLTITINP